MTSVISSISLWSTLLAPEYLKSTMGSRVILTWAIDSLRNFHFNSLLLSKVYIVWAEEYRGVIFNETEERYEIWKGIYWSFQNWHKEFDKFWPEHSKARRTFTFIVSFWAKYILLELKSTEELSFMKPKRYTKFRGNGLVVSKLT